MGLYNLLYRLSGSLGHQCRHTELASKGIFDRPIVTPIIPAAVFYKAEEYHQDFYKKDPLRYQRYRNGSGRDPYLTKIW